MPPMAGYVTFEAIGTRTRMTAVSRFVDLAQMETMLGMGMAEGMTAGDRPDRRPPGNGVGLSQQRHHETERTADAPSQHLCCRRD